MLRAMSALTPKEERFVQECVAGALPKDAYVAAYGAGRVKHPVSAARNLLAKPTVRARYEELMGELASIVVWSREKAVRELIEVREIALEHIRQTKEHRENFTEKSSRELADLPKTSTQLVISSTTELNKLFGLYDEGGDGAGKVTIIDNIPRPADG